MNSSHKDFFFGVGGSFPLARASHKIRLAPRYFMRRSRFTLDHRIKCGAMRLLRVIPRYPLRFFAQNFVYAILVLFACFSLLMIAGCSVITSADGCFEESKDSGRISRNENNLPFMHFFKLNLKQYNENIAGSIELFTLPNYTLFMQQPTHMTQSAEHYFCTRLEDGYRRGDSVFLIFADALNRRWLLNAKLNDVKFIGNLSRLNANNIPILTKVDGCEPLLAEDANFRNTHGLSENQIVFDLVRSDVPEEKLDCVEYYVKSTYNVQIPFQLPSCNHLRMALVLTRIQASNIVDQPTDALTFHEYATASMDIFDINPSYNTLAFYFRSLPKLLLKTEPKFAIGNLIIYEDLPPYNNRWDNIATGNMDEPLLAYLPYQTLIFHDVKDPKIRLYPRRSDYSSQEEPLNTEQWERKPGWYVYSYVAENVKMENFKIQLIQKLQREDIVELQLKSIAEECQHCYMSSRSAEPHCADCPTVFKALSL